MRSFLGMTGYYRNFVKNYSIVAAPFTNLNRLDTPWEWTDRCEAAFRHLKHALTHHEVLKLPDADKPFIVTTDASQYGIGAVLAQQEGKKLKSVEYMSKKMPSQKLAKSTYEKKLYAIYKALTHWKHYLLGRFFYVKTDHQTLRCMKTQPVLFDALKRWIEVIKQYDFNDFEPQYIKGEYNKVVDVLSRRPDFLSALVTEFGLADDVTQSLVDAYREDPFMAEIIRRLEAKDKETSPEFELVNGLLFLEKAGNKRLLLLGCSNPFPFRRPDESLSMDFMDTLVTSKSGMRYIYVIVDRFSKYARLVAMPETVKTKYVIKLLKENWVRDFGLPKSIISDMDVRFTSELWKVAAAEQGTQLQMTSGNHPEANGQAEQMNHAVQHLLRHYIKPNQVDEKLALIASLYNNAVHSATGVSRTVRNSQTEYAIKLFKENWGRDFGLPKSIVSDRDVRFTSELWKAAAVEQWTQLQMTFTNHPEANGQAEQRNRAVQHLLRHYIKPNQVDWDEKLALVASLYNDIVHNATGVSPNSLLLTFKPKRPLDFLLPENQPAAAPGTLEFAYRYERLMQRVVEQMHRAQAAMIASENKHCRPSTFQVGDIVWVKAFELGQEHGISRKLMPQYFGPWEVLDVVGNDPDRPSYVIRIPGHLRTYPVFHASKLAPSKETDQFPSRRSMLPPTMDGEVDINDIVDHREIAAALGAQCYRERCAPAASIINQGRCHGEEPRAPDNCTQQGK
ncbi:hypothetical protein CBR_g25944 [Chara braunii]|uniref:Integrase catalytic domain-containing protein n=1 Tax=Chara braunii TaxID=69332 RepID=A0A388L6S0_CHABU|nr:hypothetical protein CBR_g25944 [Chara braunii]|eukprot:GBG78010.1 hypothetical protein CBR_g25944 [Chara braunii]